MSNAAIQPMDPPVVMTRPSKSTYNISRSMSEVGCSYFYACLKTGAFTTYIKLMLKSSGYAVVITKMTPNRKHYHV